MGLFNRKRGDVVDLSDMHKRGLLRPVPKSDSSGVVDLSNSKEQTSHDSSGDIDFLSGLAGAETNSSDYGGSVINSLRSARRKNLESSELNELKLKLEDNDYKIRQMADRILELERKVRGFRG